MPDSEHSPEEWVSVARLGRTRGLKGEIYGDSGIEAERLGRLEQVWLRTPEGAWLRDREPLEIGKVRAYKDRLLFQFVGVESIEAAEALERCEVLIPKSERQPLAEGEFYFADLVGCEVFDRASGRKLGVVTGWQQYGGPDVLEVQVEGAPPETVAMVPFARSICVEINPAGRRIVVDPPEGLLELNG
jgi:16S rRNA processing protein RimM